MYFDYQLMLREKFDIDGEFLRSREGENSWIAIRKVVTKYSDVNQLVLNECHLFALFQECSPPSPPVPISKSASSLACSDLMEVPFNSF
jgi:hypothetical protein